MGPPAPVSDSGRIPGASPSHEIRSVRFSCSCRGWLGATAATGTVTVTVFRSVPPQQFDLSSFAQCPFKVALDSNAETEAVTSLDQ